MGEILLIALDWRLRALVRAQLRGDGWAVRAAPSLEVGLACLARSRQPPRLIILDMQGLEMEAGLLPGLVGKSPGRKFKIFTWRPSPKFLAHARKETVMDSISAGWIPAVAISLG